MRPERNAAKDIGVPQGNGLMFVDLIKQKLFQAHVKCNEVRPEKEVSTENDIFEEKECKQP